MRVLVLLFALAMPVVSWWSQSGAFGPDNGTVSDRYPTLLVAAGYAFSIWGLIFLLDLVYAAWQATGRRRDDALLATMLSLPRLFADDHRDGTLEQLALAPHPLGLVVTGKVIAHWLVSGLPLALIAPVLGIQFDLSSDALLVLTGAILLGTPALSGIGAIGAALTLGLRGGGVLLSLLVLPLYIPVLIFGAGAVDATVSGLGGEGHLSLLAAMTFASLGFAPWASAAALKIALE